VNPRERAQQRLEAALNRLERAVALRLENPSKPPEAQPQLERLAAENAALRHLLREASQELEHVAAELERIAGEQGHARS